MHHFGKGLASRLNTQLGNSVFGLRELTQMGYEDGSYMARFIKGQLA